MIAARCPFWVRDWFAGIGLMLLAGFAVSPSLAPAASICAARHGHCRWRHRA